MSILIDQNTRVIVHGITGREGTFHTQQMLKDGTKVVAGVTPGRAGQNVEGVPVYNSVKDVLREHEANCSIIFVPSPFGSDSALEAADAGIPLIVAITENTPVLDTMRIYHVVKDRGVRMIGPNCPGLISPGKSKVGIMSAAIHKPGNVGVVSRSGTLTYEVVAALTARNIGQSTSIGIGGDPIIGTSFIDVLKLFQADPETETIVMIGEIGGTDEQEAAAYIKEHVTKPVVGFIAGQSAPAGKRMGHAGAIISGGVGTAAEKMKLLNEAGVHVAEDPTKIAGIVAGLVSARS